MARQECSRVVARPSGSRRSSAAIRHRRAACDDSGTLAVARPSSGLWRASVLRLVRLEVVKFVIQVFDGFHHGDRHGLRIDPVESVIRDSVVADIALQSGRATSLVGHTQHAVRHRPAGPDGSGPARGRRNSRGPGCLIAVEMPRTRGGFTLVMWMRARFAANRVTTLKVILLPVGRADLTRSLSARGTAGALRPTPGKPDTIRDCPSASGK